jgi:hypothetical protein
MRVGAASLAPYDHYQLEFMPGAAGGWLDCGGRLTPVATTDVLDVPTTNDVGFYRLRHVP